MPRKVALSGILLALGFSGTSAQTIPNSVEIRTYSEQYGTPRVTRSFADGLGRGLATTVDQGAGDIVSGTAYDGFGRPYRTAKPYYIERSGGAHGWPTSSALDVIAEANSYYNGSSPERPNANLFAYSELKMSSDPLSRVLEKGSPGSGFSLVGAHPKFWRIGVSTADFLPTTSLTEFTLNSWPPGSYSYFLDVVKDADGNYSQILMDRFERVIKTWFDPKTPGSSEKIVSQSDYDYSGNIVKTFTPGAGSAPDPNMYSTFRYATDGQLLSETHPDEGRIDYFRDRAGRLRLVQDARQQSLTRTNSEFWFIKYDIFGREIASGILNVPSPEVGTVTDPVNLGNPNFPQEGEGLVKIRKVYDDALHLCLKLDLPAGFDQGLRNLKGRLAGRVVYGEFGSKWDNRVGEIFSYYDNGLLEFKYVFVPTLPVQYVHYNYDLQGRPTSKYIYHIDANGNMNGPTVMENVYDVNGRLAGIRHNGDWAAVYSYTKTGLLNKKDFWKNLNSVAHQTFTYNIRDGLSFTQGNRTNTALYQEELNYETVGTYPKFDGTISRARHKYFLGSIQPEYILNYKYDGTNRLLEVQNSGIEGEIFTYDVKGRINTSKQANPRPLYGPFEYTANTNKVARIPGHPTRASTLGNFVYDPNGNMVFDRSKKLAVTYDWRGLPVRYRFYTSVPDRAITWTEVESLGAVRSEVEMLYDASGNRVLKRAYRYN